MKLGEADYSRLENGGSLSVRVTKSNTELANDLPIIVTPLTYQQQMDLNLPLPQDVSLRAMNITAASGMAHFCCNSLCIDLLGDRK